MLLGESLRGRTPSRAIEDKSFGRVVLFARRPTFVEAIAWRNALLIEGNRQAASLLVICNWMDVVDDDGKPVPFSVEAFQESCTLYPVLMTRAAEFGAEMFAKSIQEVE